MTLTDDIRRKAQELGFAKLGIAHSGALVDEGARLQEWLGYGYHASLEWMVKNIDKRKDPRLIVSGARSVIVVADNYFLPNASKSSPEVGKISRYAWGDDYHRHATKRIKSLYDSIKQMEPESTGRYYVDTGPVMEKAWAVRAGVGWQGKHSTLITKEYGSWVFLGAIISTLELEYDEPATDRCGTCTACIDACPTGAIVTPYVVDAGRCISYQTIEHRRPIESDQAGNFGQWLFGCDTCQDVCPWNRFAQPSSHPEYAPRPGNVMPGPNEWSAMTQDEFSARFSKSAIKRTTLAGMVRNAEIVRKNIKNNNIANSLSRSLTKRKPMDRKHRNVIIIGSGPAGLTAGIYTGRANLAPIIFEGSQPGGQLTITTEVENFPGFPKGIMGPELMSLLREQAVTFGAESVMNEVSAIDFTQRPFKVVVDEEEYFGDAVIVATGASAKLLNIPSETEYMGYGVSACATCDGFFYRGKEVFVVGGGDTALEEANFLTRFAQKVTIIHRRDEFRGSKIMRDRVLKNQKVSVVWNSVVDEVKGKKENGKKYVTGLRLKNVKTGAITEVTADGLFIAIGHQPNTSLFKGVLPMDEKEYLLVHPGSTCTDIPGIFAAGDVADSYYRQAVSAAGRGCMAAIDAERFLESQE